MISGALNLAGASQRRGRRLMEIARVLNPRDKDFPMAI
jgi:hypothetical protein